MRLDLRNAANSLQIEGKGVLPGDPYHWGGPRGSRPKRSSKLSCKMNYNLRMTVPYLSPDHFC